MQRAGQRAVLGALARLAQVDQQDIGAAEALDGLDGGERQPLLGQLVLMQTDTNVGGHRTSIIFGFGSFRLLISSTYSSTDLHLQPRIIALLLADGGDSVALVVVGGKYQGFVRQFQQAMEDRIILFARAAVLEIGPAGAADQKRIAGEDAIAHQDSCRNRRCGRACT